MSDKFLFTVPVLDFAIRDPENTPAGIMVIKNLDGLKHGDFFVSFSPWDGIKKTNSPYLVAQIIGHAPVVRQCATDLGLALKKAKILIVKWNSKCHFCQGSGVEVRHIKGTLGKYECRGCKGTGKPLVKPSRRRARK